MASKLECDACGIQVPETEGLDWISLTMDGRTYDFSSRACLELFICADNKKSPAKAGDEVTL